MVLFLSFLIGLFCFIILSMLLLKLNVSAHRIDVQIKVQPYMEQLRVRTSTRPRRKVTSRIWEACSHVVHPVGNLIISLPQTIALDKYMQQADLPFHGADFFVLLCLAGLLAGLAGTILFQNLLAGLVLALLAVGACLFWLRLYIRRRRNAFAYQLGDALTMMSNAMRAGFSFDQAMDLIGHEMNPPVSSEFTKAIMTIKLGSNLEAALEQMGQRMPGKDLDMVITAVLIQRQVGGDLSRVLDITAQTIRERISMSREIRTLTAQGRFSGYVLVGLPFAFAGLMTVINPSFMKPMLTEPMGHVLLMAGVVLDGIGLMIIRKLVHVEL
jgi:tight adherence protein B